MVSEIRDLENEPFKNGLQIFSLRLKFTKRETPCRFSLETFTWQCAQERVEPFEGVNSGARAVETIYEYFFKGSTREFLLNEPKNCVEHRYNST